MSTSPAASSLEHEQEKVKRETIVPDGVKQTVSRHVEDGDGADSSLNVQISERQMSWQRTAVLL